MQTDRVVRQLKSTLDHRSMTQDIRARLGERLKALRKKKGLTQAELADKLGLDRSYVGEIEQGKRNPCLVNLGIIAQGLDTTLSKMLFRI